MFKRFSLILFITLILSQYSLSNSNSLGEREPVGVWVVENVQCLGGRAIHFGVESGLSPLEMTKFQKKLESEYPSEMCYEFKENGTFTATMHDKPDSLLREGKWELMHGKLRLVGFDSFCTSCESFFELIQINETQLSLVNFVPFSLEDDPFLVSKAIIQYAVVLTKK